MAPSSDLVQAGIEGFSLLEECMGRKARPPLHHRHPHQLPSATTPACRQSQNKKFSWISLSLEPWPWPFGDLNWTRSHKAKAYSPLWRIYCTIILTTPLLLGGWSIRVLNFLFLSQSNSSQYLGVQEANFCIKFRALNYRSTQRDCWANQFIGAWHDKAIYFECVLHIYTHTNPSIISKFSQYEMNNSSKFSLNWDF